MGYKTYFVNEKESLSMRGGTDGYQPKFIIGKENKFIKVQCILNNTLRDDWRVEDIASRICQQLNIYHVKQTPCKVILKNKNKADKMRLGVVSDNFEKSGLKFISFETLLNMQGITSNCSEFIRTNALGKINFIVQNIGNITNIDKKHILNYVFDMVTVDMLVLNQDRHVRNFGVFKNNNTGKYQIAMLFDFGMGLFENDTVFDNAKSLEECMRYSYIAPYGDDPFELLDLLKTNRAYLMYLKSKNIRDLHINKSIFIQNFSYEYYSKIKKQMEV